MSTKRYCDFCGEEVRSCRSLTYYFDMENQTGHLVRVRVNLGAASLFKPLIGSKRERQLSDPDMCLPCLRRVVMEGDLQS